METIPDFVPENWDPTVTSYLGTLIHRANRIIEFEYALNPAQKYDDTCNWTPKNFRFTIEHPDRVSREAIRRLNGIDVDIGKFL